MNKFVKVGLILGGTVILGGTATLYLLDSSSEPIVVKKRPHVQRPHLASPAAAEDRGVENQGVGELSSTANRVRVSQQGNPTMPHTSVSATARSLAGRLPSGVRSSFVSRTSERGASAPSSSGSRYAAYYGMGGGQSSGSKSNGDSQNSGFIFNKQLKETLDKAVDTLVKKKVGEIKSEKESGSDDLLGGKKKKEEKPRIVDGKVIELHKIPTMLYFSTREVVGGKVVLIGSTGVAMSRGEWFSGGKIKSIGKSNIYLDIDGKTYKIPYIITYGDTETPEPSYCIVKTVKKRKVKVLGNATPKPKTVIYYGLGDEPSLKDEGESSSDKKAEEEKGGGDTEGDAKIHLKDGKIYIPPSKN